MSKPATQISFGELQFFLKANDIHEGKGNQQRLWATRVSNNCFVVLPTLPNTILFGALVKRKHLMNLGVQFHSGVSWETGPTESQEALWDKTRLPLKRNNIRVLRWITKQLTPTEPLTTKRRVLDHVRWANHLTQCSALLEDWETIANQSDNREDVKVEADVILVALNRLLTESPKMKEGGSHNTKTQEIVTTFLRLRRRFNDSFPVPGRFLHLVL